MNQFYAIHLLYAISFILIMIWAGMASVYIDVKFMLNNNKCGISEAAILKDKNIVSRTVYKLILVTRRV